MRSRLRLIAAVLERVPDVDDVLIDDGGERRARERLARNGYDACVVTWATPRTARVVHHAAIPYASGKPGASIPFDLPTASSCAAKTATSPRIGRICCSITPAQSAATPRTGSIASCRLTDDAREADELSAASGRFLILNPCNAVASRRRIWPLEGWAALAGWRCTNASARAFSLAARQTDAPMAQEIVHLSRSDAIVSIAGHHERRGFGALAQGARRPSSESRPVPCTSQRPSAARPSASFLFNPTFPTAGRRWESIPPSSEPRFPVIGVTQKRAARTTHVSRISIGRVSLRRCSSLVS